MSIEDSINLDELVVVGLEPTTWCRFAKLQIDLLRSHVQGLEKGINESIKAYEKERIATEVVHYEDEYPVVILEEHRGIESTPNDLEEIFEYYFPNLQRRSTLITLFSFLEHQLDQLCELFASTRQLTIVHTDLKDKGIDRSRSYLRKVVCLPMDDSSAAWQEIKRIQRVRNIVVHNDAKLVDKEVIKYVDQAKYLSRKSNWEDKADEVNILEGYLTHVLDTFDLHCSDLNKAISN